MTVLQKSAPAASAQRVAAAWHPEATRLRDAGMSFNKIGNAVGRSDTVIREFLNENETKRKALEAFAAGRIDRTALMAAITAARPDTSAERMGTVRAACRDDLAQRAGAV